MKKFLSLALALVMVLALAACGGDNTDDGGNDDGTFKFERKIEIVCPWGAGGGADTTVRQFATQLEKELGQTVVVNNVAGAGGVSQ